MGGTCGAGPQEMLPEDCRRRPGEGSGALGFDDPNVRLIQDEVLKFTDGRWSSRSGIVFQHGTVMLAAFTANAVQHFEFDGPVMKDTVVKMSSKELPDIEELNAKIPREEWDTDRFGNTNPPWRHQYIVYLEDPQTASLYTYINSTDGAEIAVGKLEGQLKRMTWLCGKRLGAVVELHEQLVSKQYKKWARAFRSQDGLSSSMCRRGWHRRRRNSSSMSQSSKSSSTAPLH